MPRVANFAYIVKIAAIFIKTTFKDSNQVDSRTQGVCHMIYIFFGSSLGKVKLSSFIIVGYVWQILGRVGLFAPPTIREQPRKGLSWIRLRLTTLGLNNEI